MDHPKDIGDRTTLATMLALIECGYAVFCPFGENTRYDLVIDDGESLLRVQCKKLFALTDAGVVRACRTSTGFCRQRRLRPGRYRFAAAAVDEWGRSAPTYSSRVFVRPKRIPK